jgi:mono/diheme cytochrome c family protein
MTESRWRSSAILSCSLLAVFSVAAVASSNGGWLAKVPTREHSRINPYHDQAEAVAAGQRVFREHCAQCHGEDAMGTKGRPSLRSDHIQQQATEGDLHWVVNNGSMAQGMPSWAKLGDARIWQVVTYVKSLGTGSGEVGSGSNER